jgi:gamma-glutamyltranspeptidase/glutathione hydrolase
MARAGGLLAAADLAGFRAEEAGAAHGWLPRAAPVALPPPPAGGIMVAEMLRILERFDLPALGHNSAEYMRVVAEAMKVAGRDKDRHVGDPRFVPPPGPAAVRRLRGGVRRAIRAGEKARLPRAGADSEHTTTVSCVDAEGMVVSLTHTLGVPSGVIPPGTGFMLNGAMNWCDPRPGRAAPSRRASGASPP